MGLLWNALFFSVLFKLRFGLVFFFSCGVFLGPFFRKSNGLFWVGPVKLFLKWTCLSSKKRQTRPLWMFFEIQKTKKLHHSPSESLRFVLLFFVSTSWPKKSFTTSPYNPSFPTRLQRHNAPTASFSKGLLMNLLEPRVWCSRRDPWIPTVPVN